MNDLSSIFTYSKLRELARILCSYIDLLTGNIINPSKQLIDNLSQYFQYPLEELLSLRSNLLSLKFILILISDEELELPLTPYFLRINNNKWFDEYDELQRFLKEYKFDNFLLQLEKINDCLSNRFFIFDEIPRDDLKVDRSTYRDLEKEKSIFNFIRDIRINSFDVWRKILHNI